MAVKNEGSYYVTTWVRSHFTFAAMIQVCLLLTGTSYYVPVV